MIEMNKSWQYYFEKKDNVPELIHPVSSFLFLKEEKGLWLHHQIIICHVEKESLEHVTYAQLALAGTHLAIFDKKVHKPKSKSYGRIGANMQLFLLISKEFEYFYHIFWGSEGLPRDPYWCIIPI